MSGAIVKQPFHRHRKNASPHMPTPTDSFNFSGRAPGDYECRGDERPDIGPRLARSPLEARDRAVLSATLDATSSNQRVTIDDPMFPVTAVGRCSGGGRGSGSDGGMACATLGGGGSRPGSVGGVPAAAFSTRAPTFAFSNSVRSPMAPRISGQWRLNLIRPRDPRCRHRRTWSLLDKIRSALDLRD